MKASGVPESDLREARDERLESITHHKLNTVVTLGGRGAFLLSANSVGIKGVILQQPASATWPYSTVELQRTAKALSSSLHLLSCRIVAGR